MPPAPPLDFFRGDGVRPSSSTRIDSLVISDDILTAQTDPSGYRLLGPGGEAVRAAVNVALVLRLPLLVSGEPGSGKTQLAYAVAHELGRHTPLRFVTKSVSQARDLLYAYDAVQHFRAAQAGITSDVRDYIEYSALGLAILAGAPMEVRRRFLSPAVFDTTRDGELAPETLAVRELLRAESPQQLVLLIDEIDKAPRDFPNDLLSEIETMSFNVPELGGLEVSIATPALRPIVLITTNSERPLPEAFVRRCAYVHIDYPRDEALEEILSSRLAGVFRRGSPLMRDTADFFQFVRKQGSLQKDPGLSELLQFLQALAALGADPEERIERQQDLVLGALPVFGKSHEDQERLAAMLRGWGGLAGR